VRFLRVLGFVLVAARRIGNVIAAIVTVDHPPDGANGFLRHVDTVGAHVSDETDRLAANIDAFIQPLRQSHGVGGREAELAAGFLLQGRGGEGRRRIAPRRLGFHRRDGEARMFEGLLEGFGFRAGADVEALDLLAVGADKASFKTLFARGRQRCRERPIFARHETFDLELTIGDQPQRHRLHAAGGTGARQFAP
jgi:hypothetical protein